MKCLFLLINFFLSSFLTFSLSLLSLFLSFFPFFFPSLFPSFLPCFLLTLFSCFLPSFFPSSYVSTKTLHFSEKIIVVSSCCFLVCWFLNCQGHVESCLIISFNLFFLFVTWAPEADSGLTVTNNSLPAHTMWPRIAWPELVTSTNDSAETSPLQHLIDSMQADRSSGS